MDNYQDSKEILEIIKGGGRGHGKSFSQNLRRILKEEAEKKEKDAIAITNDPKFGTNVLQSQIDAFRSSVCPGASFSPENTQDPESNPLVYFPKTGNIVFSGTIPSMADLKFQISCNDVTGAPYIFVDGLPLTPKVAETLKLLSGFAQNFIAQWSSVGDLLGNMK